MKKYVYLIILIVFINNPCMTAATEDNASAKELFFSANNAYKEGRFKDAIENYHRLITERYLSGEIYYNLGNAYFRTNEIGKAILYYERAQIYIPRDPDLNFNLRFAAEQTRDAIHKSERLLDKIFFWLKFFNLAEIFWVFAILNILMWSALLVKSFITMEWSYHIIVMLLVFWIGAGLSFGLKWYQIETDDRAVILQKEVNIMAGPDRGDTVLFKLHEGTIVHHERSEDDWWLIHLSDNKRGWVQRENLERINIRAGSIS